MYKITKKIIREVPTLELIMRMNELHEKCKRRSQDAGIPKPDIWEANAIFKEMNRRYGRIAALFYVGRK